MDTTPNWAIASEYKETALKRDLVTMGRALHHAHTTLKDEHRTLELQLIESRASVRALNTKIEQDAVAMRKLVATIRRSNQRNGAEREFTMQELSVASAAYCTLHNLSSVSLETVKQAMRDGVV